MARHEWNFEAAGEARLSRGEARSLSAARAEADPAPTRENALACFLSGAEGWDEAVRRLDGAFADPPAVKTNED